MNARIVKHVCRHYIARGVILSWIGTFLCFTIPPTYSITQSTSPENADSSFTMSLEGTTNGIEDSIYDAYLRKAEWAYTFWQYNKAKKWYTKAIKIKPEAYFPKQRIESIDRIITRHQTRGIILGFDFEKPTLLIASLIIVIVFSLTSMVIVLIIILITRNRRVKREALQNSLREKYQALLIEYLFSPEEGSTVKEKIGDIAASHFTRDILINEMKDLSINLKGQTSIKLRELYLDLDLHLESLGKASAEAWHVKIKGFRELAFMNIQEGNPIILESLDSHNDVLRMEAQLALVRLNEDDPFGFLDYLEKPFTLWEQLNVHEMIIQHNITPPEFKRWLHSPNKSIILFALQMIKAFRQSNALPNMIDLLESPDEIIRYNTIVTMGEMRLKEALPHLKHLYKSESYENCFAIVHAMNKMPDESMLGFLKLVIDKEDDVQLQIQAAMAISQMGEVGKVALEKMLRSDYKNYQIIIKHVLDKRIS
jgi:tetratricopeptide (TPR) repeat protein